jgi:hypothetical protein
MIFFRYLAPIDLKKSVIQFQDGSTRTGAVNNAAGYAAGATTMAVDGFTSAISNGETFTVVGSTLTHTVSSTVGGSTPTSITFTPALDGAVLDNAVITMGPRSITVKVGEGNLVYTEKKNFEYIKDRGKLDTVREGDEEPIDVKLEFTWEFIKSDTGQTPTVEEVLKQIGNASTWVSSSSDTCEPYAVDIFVTYTPPCTGVKKETVLLQDFRYEELNHDYKAAQVSVTGKCNVKQATVNRVT